MSLLTSTAPIVRVDGLTQVMLLVACFSSDVPNDEIATIVLQPAGTAGDQFSPDFTHSSPAQFVAIVSDRPIEVSLNGSPVFEAKNLMIDNSNITSITLVNLDSENCASIRLVLGGGVV